MTKAFKKVGISKQKGLNNPTVQEKKTRPREETLPKQLLSLKKKTAWSWERMCREFHRVMGEEGPSHTTLLRYATKKVKRPHVVIERYVREAIRKITRELGETQRKQLKKALRESEERFRNLVEHNNDMVWEVNQEGAYTYVSPNVKNLLGYSPEQLIGKTPFEFMPEKEAERVGKIFGQAVHERRLFTSLQHQALCKSGKVILLECSGKPIINTDGTFQGYRGIDRDITKREGK